MVDIAEYKRRQSAPGTKISIKAFGRDRRLPITNRFREALVVRAILPRSCHCRPEAVTSPHGSVHRKRPCGPRGGTIDLRPGDRAARPRGKEIIMSEVPTLYGGPPTRRVRTRDLLAAKTRGDRWPMLTSYDKYTAAIFDQAGVPVLLVGDSAANNVFGYETTVPVTVDELLPLVRAVVRGDVDAR